MDSLILFAIVGLANIALCLFMLLLLSMILVTIFVAIGDSFRCCCLPPWRERYVAQAGDL